MQGGTCKLHIQTNWQKSHCEMEAKLVASTDDGMNNKITEINGKQAV